MKYEKEINAIILAAGMGTRLQPVTNKLPKCLISIYGIPIIENQIQALRKLGVNRICIIAGYLCDKLAYLVKKYPNIEIRVNNKFNLYNNLYSLYLALDMLGDSFILDGDVYWRLLPPNNERRCTKHRFISFIYSGEVLF